MTTTNIHIPNSNQAQLDPNFCSLHKTRNMDFPYLEFCPQVCPHQARTPRLYVYPILRHSVLQCHPISFLNPILHPHSKGIPQHPHCNCLLKRFHIRKLIQDRAEDKKTRREKTRHDKKDIRHIRPQDKTSICYAEDLLFLKLIMPSACRLQCLSVQDL